MCLGLADSMKLIRWVNCSSSLLRDLPWRKLNLPFSLACVIAAKRLVEARLASYRILPYVSDPGGSKWVFGGRSCVTVFEKVHSSLDACAMSLLMWGDSSTSKRPGGTYRTAA